MRKLIKLIEQDYLDVAKFYKINKNKMFFKCRNPH